MNIHITGRQIDVTAPIKSYTESRLRKLGRFMNGITDIHVTLSVEKYRQRAEVNVHSRGNTYLTAVEESDDLYTSILQAVEKIETQARKKHAKRIGKKRRGNRREGSGTFNVIAREEPSDADAGPRIIESRRFVIKPLSVEEAVVEMDAAEAEFLVFRNASDENVNVIYRRPDGNYGLIDPGGQ
jgi:putative sigma-54 modulation protein